MTTFSCDGLSEMGVRDFTRAIARYQRETSRDMRAAIRSATVDLVKSLRARTRKSPKFVDRKDVRFGETPPKYVTNEGGTFRRVVVNRYNKGQLQRKVHWIQVAARYNARRTKSGGVTESWKESSSQMLSEARKRFGRIKKWGLAKKSWGWFMHALFQKSAPNENPRAEVDARMVEGGLREWREQLPDGTIDLSAPIRCEIDIVNKLDYIRKAMPAGSVAKAVQAATNSIEHKIEAGLKSRRFAS